MKLQITSVFSKFLAKKARELAAQGLVKIIEVNDFPDGAPLHEDGSTSYDPKKPMVLFAVQTATPAGEQAWADACREFDDLAAHTKSGAKS